jgi:hypothetical protein
MATENFVSHVLKQWLLLWWWWWWGGGAGRLDAELSGVARRVSELLTRLPGDINPVSLEELRRVKAALVELEDKADNLRWAACVGLGW